MIYVAGASREGEKVRYWESELRKYGVAVTSTWSRDCESWAGKDALLPLEDARRRAQLCAAEVGAADIVWLLWPSASTIGAFWEAGLAQGLGKRLVISGPGFKSCAFYTHAELADPHDSKAFVHILETRNGSAR